MKISGTNFLVPGPWIISRTCYSVKQDVNDEKWTYTIIISRHSPKISCMITVSLDTFLFWSCRTLHWLEPDYKGWEQKQLDFDWSTCPTFTCKIWNHNLNKRVKIFVEILHMMKIKQYVLMWNIPLYFLKFEITWVTINFEALTHFIDTP